MLLAYIDEVGEPGAFVSKTHPKYRTSPAFGYAGFVIPEEEARRFGQTFTIEKRTLFKGELETVKSVGRWEKKGSDIFRPQTWNKYPQQVRVLRGLIKQLKSANGAIFFYVEEKQVGTPAQIQSTREELEANALRETVNRLCTYAEAHGQNLLILMDQVNESQRTVQVAELYAHVFSRSQEHPEMKSIIEPPMHIDSALSSNIQFADWIASAVGRAVDYQLIEESAFTWIPEALGESMRHSITNESKLRLWKSSLSDFHHFDLFRVKRRLFEGKGLGGMSPENVKKLEMVKHAAEKDRRRKGSRR